jgi:hypothetical protein
VEWLVRQGLVLSDGLRVNFFGVALPVSLLFLDNFFYTQPMLIMIRYPGSYRHFTPGYTVHQAIALMHGSKDLITVANF